jgi:hypothetical protein
MPARTFAGSARFLRHPLILFSMLNMALGYAQDHFLPPLIGRINNIYLRERGLDLPVRRGSGLARVLRQTVPPSIQLRVREVVGQAVQDWLIDHDWRGGKACVCGAGRRRCRLPQTEYPRPRTGRVFSWFRRGPRRLRQLLVPSAEGASCGSDQRYAQNQARGKSHGWQFRGSCWSDWRS